MDSDYRYENLGPSSAKPLPSPRERTIQKILERFRQHKIKWLTVVAMMILILVAVIMTGVFFAKTGKIAKGRHDSKSGNDETSWLNPNISNAEYELFVIFTLDLNAVNADDPSMSYTLEGIVDNQDGQAPTTGRPVCVQIYDTQALNPQAIMSINPPHPLQNPGIAYINTTSLNVSMDGFLSRYPLDVYEGSLLVLSYINTNQALSCEDASYDPDVDQIVPSTFSFGQNLEGFVSINSGKEVTLSPNDVDTPSLGPGTVTLSFTVRRVRVIQFFALIMFITTWLLTLGVLFATIQVIIHNKDSRFDLVAAGTALLFALPTLRSAQPGIPITPTIYDIVGYFWNIALLAFSTFVLICHSIYHLEVDKKEPGCACRSAMVEKNCDSKA